LPKVLLKNKPKIVSQVSSQFSRRSQKIKKSKLISLMLQVQQTKKDRERVKGEKKKKGTTQRGAEGELVQRQRESWAEKRKKKKKKEERRRRGGEGEQRKKKKKNPKKANRPKHPKTH
jgi:hypothetical protein